MVHWVQWRWIYAHNKAINSLRPRQNGHHFADDPFKRIFLNETLRISIKISLNFVPKGPINDIPALVQIMGWRRRGDKPLYGPWWLVYWRIYASLGLNELTLLGIPWNMPQLGKNRSNAHSIRSILALYRPSAGPSVVQRYRINTK